MQNRGYWSGHGGAPTATQARSALALAHLYTADIELRFQAGGSGVYGTSQHVPQREQTISHY